LAGGLPEPPVTAESSTISSREVTCPSLEDATGVAAWLLSVEPVGVTTALGLRSQPKHL
jgi:hypothetical protein